MPIGQTEQRIISAKENLDDLVDWTRITSGQSDAQPTGALVQVFGPDQECWSEIQYQRAKSSS